MLINYINPPDFTVDEFIDLLNKSGLGVRRPDDDRQCVGRMLENANLILVAMGGDKLVGISRSVTDFSYADYLSDLAIHKDYQRQGIGKRLIKETRKFLDEKCNFVLLSAPAAKKYYPAIGFESHPSAWILPSGKEL